MEVLAPPQIVGPEQLIFKLLSANMNSTADQVIVKQLGFTNYLLTRVRVANASTSLTTAAGGIYTGASKAGIAVVAAGQVYSALTASTLGVDLTIAAAGLVVLTAAGLNLSLTTGQGGAATADFYVFGVPLT